MKLSGLLDLERILSWLGDRLDGDLRAFAFGYALLLPAFLAPIVVTSILPGLDLPFHVALADMIAKAGTDSSPYAGSYEPRFWPPPPALPWVSLALASKVMSLGVALRVMIGVYVAALPLAVAACCRAFGASAAPALLAFPLAYNMGLHYGFFGYVLSLPPLFGLLACAGALFRSPPRNRLGWAATVAAMAVLLYGCHLETYVLGVAAALGIAVTMRTDRLTRLWCGCGLMPSIAIATVWHMATPFASGAERRAIGPMVSAVFATRHAELEGRTVLRDIAFRIEGVPVHLLRGFHDHADRYASAALLVLVAAYIVLSLVRAMRAPPDRAGLARFVMPAIALCTYVGLPHHLDQYEAMSISPRLAPLFVLAVVAALPIARTARSPHVIGQRLKRSLFIATLAFSFTYGAVLAREYAAFAREVNDFRAAIAALPAGGRLVGLVFRGESRVMNVESVIRALPSLYVALRPAPGSMVPLRYCGMRHIPCSLGPRTLPPLDPWHPEAFDARVFASHFDFVLANGGPPQSVLFKDVPVTLVATRGEWSAYRMGARSVP